MLIATHDGSFHADEVFAVAALGLLGEPIEVLRTRDRDALARADVRVDVGFRHDPSTGDFDHHQRDFDGVRPNGIRYASFGLIWREFGARVCEGDRRSPTPSTRVWSRGSMPTTPVSSSASRWSTACTRSPSTGSSEASTRAGMRPSRPSRSACASTRRSTSPAASSPVRCCPPPPAGARRASSRRRSPPPPTRASSSCPSTPRGSRSWCRRRPTPCYIVYPKRQGFGLEAVPRELGSFENRRDLPAAWGGLEGDDLVAATGVPDALFCHSKRFLVVASSHDGIEQLARLALAGD